MMRLKGNAPLVWALMLTMALSIGCAGGQTAKGSPEPQWVGQLDVVNRSSSDMDIYVVLRGSRVRIGLAPNSKTTTFKLSPAQVAGAGSVQFLAIPIAGGGEAAQTEPVHISPKDTVVLDVPPP
jgi:hypothetical protein